MDNYQEYAKLLSGLPTGIHTRISDHYRISSAYRRFANAFFESWGWETLLWVDDKIEYQYKILHSLEDVVNLHTKIHSYFWDCGEFYKDNEEEE